MVDSTYVYAPFAQDADGDPLTYSLLQAPSGMTINPTSGRIEWTPDAGQLGNQDVQITVDDGHGGTASQQFVIAVVGTAPNLAPIIVSAPALLATQDEPYLYVVRGEDSNNDPLTYELLTGPGGMSLNAAAGEISFTPIAGDIGIHRVKIRVSDPSGAAAIQAFDLEVRPTNVAPSFVTTPPTEVVLGQTLGYSAAANDSGDRVFYNLLDAPTGASIDHNSGLLQWTPAAGDLGDHPIEIQAVDERGLATVQSFLVSVVADSIAPRVSISSDHTVLQPGDSVTIEIKASDNVALDAISATVDGVPIALDANHQATFVVTTPGLPVIEATATDTAGNVSTVQRRLRVIDTADQTAPTVELHLPVIDSTVTYLTDVVASVDGTDIEFWRLEYSLSGMNNWNELATGDSPVANEAIGVFDPTLLANDRYDLRLTAQDFSGNVASSTIFVNVTGAAKLGNFSVSFDDFTLPLAGIPITITRTYDTLQAGFEGDFGFGWSLAVGQGRIRESLPPTQAELDGVPAMFSGQRGLRAGDRVFVTTPDGQRVSFTFDPTPSGALLGTVWSPQFTPDPGVYEQLTVDHVALSQRDDGSFGVYLIGTPYNPRTYTLITKDQRRYVYDQFDELQSVTDRNDVTLTFTDLGIFSSAGPSIQFVRDGQGRISQIVGPMGTARTYQYDAAGDLESVTDATGLVTSIAYSDSHPHFLDSVTDPRGVVAYQVQYDDDGRYIGLVDATGSAVTQQYNLPAQELVTADALGNATTLVYDALGNITQATDPLGNTTLATYDDPLNPYLETSVTDARGVVTQFAYDDRGNMTSILEPDRVTTVQYNSPNDITRIDGPSPTTPESGFEPTVVTMTYDANGNLQSFTNAAGETENLVYDGFGRILSATDAEGNTMELEYGSFKNPDAIQFADGSQRAVIRNSMGAILTATNELGQSVQFAYDNAGRPLSVTDALGNQYQDFYDGGLLVRTVDPLGRETKFEYDDRNRLTKVVDPLDGEILRSYDANNRLLSLTNQLGQTESWTYTSNGDAATYTDTAGNTTLYAYDAVSNRISVEDARGFVTGYSYDDQGRLIAVTDALGGAETYEYDVRDNVVAVVDRNGGLTEFSYDDVHRPLSVTDALGGEQTWTYDQVGNNTSYTDQRGNTTLLEYDSRNRLVRQEDALGFEQLWAYDAASRLTQFTDQEANAWQYAWDANSHLVGVTDPLGGLTSFTYDAVGNRLSTTDELGRTSSQAFDGLDRLILATDADGQQTAFGYDAVGNLIGLTDPLGNTTTWQYNDQNQVSVRTDPLGQSETYAYDAVGNLTQSEDRLGRITDYSYDGLSRMTAEVWKAADGTTLQTYNYGFDANSNLTSADGPNSAYSFDYDLLDRVTSVDNAGSPNLPGLVLNYTYDEFGNLTEVADNAGVTVDSTFDARNLVESTTWSGGGIDDARVDYARDGRGLVTGVSRFNDLSGMNLVSQTNSVFDALGRITQISHLTSTGSVLADYEFSFDAAGQMVQQIVNGDVSDYSYDATGQLTGAMNSGRPDEAYAYDANGNRIDGNFIIGANNQLLSDGTFDYEYDAEGNLTRKTEIASGDYTVYEFDHRNRMVSATKFSSGGIILSESSFSYDVFDRMIARTVDADGAGPQAAETSYTVYDGQNVWADFDDAGNVVARYLFGQSDDENVARWRPGQGTVWYLTDSLGSVRDLVDAAGSVVDHIEYDSFGNTLSESNPLAGDRFKFAGREWIAAASLYYYRARFYDPGTSRFISQDPIGFAGGDVNLQRYVGNHPLTSTDPSGRSEMVLYTQILQNDLAVAGAQVGFAGGFVCGFLDGWYRTGTVEGGLQRGAQDAVMGAALGAALGYAAGSPSLVVQLFTVGVSALGAIPLVRDLADSVDVTHFVIKTACFTATALYGGAKFKGILQQNRTVGRLQHLIDVGEQLQRTSRLE